MITVALVEGQLTRPILEVLLERKETDKRLRTFVPDPENVRRWQGSVAPLGDCVDQPVEVILVAVDRLSEAVAMKADWTILDASHKDSDKSMRMQRIPTAASCRFEIELHPKSGHNPEAAANLIAAHLHTQGRYILPPKANRSPRRRRSRAWRRAG